MLITKEIKLKVLTEARKVVINNLYNNLTTGICAGVKSACAKYGLSSDYTHQILRELHSKYAPGSDFIGWWFPTDTGGRLERVRVLNTEISFLETQLSDKSISDKKRLEILKDLKSEVKLTAQYGICKHLFSVAFLQKHNITEEQARDLIRALRDKYVPDKSVLDKWFPFDEYGQLKRLNLLDQEISLIEQLSVTHLCANPDLSTKDLEYMYMNSPNLGILSPPKETTKPKRVKQLMLIEYDKLDHLSPITEKSIKDAIFRERNAKVTEIKVFDQG